MRLRIAMLGASCMLLCAGCAANDHGFVEDDQAQLKAAEARRDFIIETVRRLQQQGLQVRSIQIAPDGEYFMYDRGRLSNSLKDYTPAFSEPVDAVDTESQGPVRAPLTGKKGKAE
ncbi:MAG: hypothetical protein JXQ75_05535 [Phycisphaerae bacterium]|nr:hypothetical protein [Phycisphaerae bacterium]